jgi:hypothetical protein
MERERWTEILQQDKAQSNVHMKGCIYEVKNEIWSEKRNCLIWKME